MTRKRAIGRPPLHEKRVIVRAKLSPRAYADLMTELTRRKVQGDRVQVGTRKRPIDAGDLLTEAIDLVFSQRLYRTRPSAALSILETPREQIGNAVLRAETSAHENARFWCAFKAGHREPIECASIGDRFGIAWGESASVSWIVARDIESALDQWGRGDSV